MERSEYNVYCICLVISNKASFPFLSIGGLYIFVDQQKEVIRCRCWANAANDVFLLRKGGSAEFRSQLRYRDFPEVALTAS